MTDEGDQGRKLRATERKHYTDEGLDDDEIEGKRNYSIEAKLTSSKYNADHVVSLKGEEFNYAYIQQNGLINPIIFLDKTGLGMRVPSENFKVSDVKQCVGSRRTLDVMDVNTQKGMEMSMKDWVRYFENPQRERLLNVISLEFSHTRLENYVESPTVVRQMDWVDVAWPQHFKDWQTDATNAIEKMKYPKVRKYCLMSVAGCYTDFHIDFGGTSVWYHILHGEKIFWLVPPTDKNIELFENWVLSAKQGDSFFADEADGCQRIALHQGTTFIIPSGWIHAVFTPKDSLVFGGNFLHSFNVKNQLRITEVEDRIHVPHKFRYPFNGEMLWYVLERYVNCLMGKTHLSKHVEEDVENQDPDTSVKMDDSPSSLLLDKSLKIELIRVDDERSMSPRISPSVSESSLSFKVEKSDIKNDQTPNKDSVQSMETTPSDTEQRSARKAKQNSIAKPGGDNKVKLKDVHLTKWEIAGLRELVEKLEALPHNKRNVPKYITDDEAVLSDIRQLLKGHENDDPVRAVTGEPALVWPPTKKKAKSRQKCKLEKGEKKSSSSGIRRRRTRCKKCEACTRTECGECNFCKDMKKFGGPGRMKQTCVSRQCMAPVLPTTAKCMICDEDEKIKSDDEVLTTLMECGICWEIMHPVCLQNKYENLDNEGSVNEDLPNSWECPKCCHDGKQGSLKPRMLKGITKTSKSPLEADQENSGKMMFEGKRVTSNGRMNTESIDDVEHIESHTSEADTDLEKKSEVKSETNVTQEKVEIAERNSNESHKTTSEPAPFKGSKKRVTTPRKLKMPARSTSAKKTTDVGKRKRLDKGRSSSVGSAVKRAKLSSTNTSPSSAVSRTSPHSSAGRASRRGSPSPASATGMKRSRRSTQASSPSINNAKRSPRMHLSPSSSSSDKLSRKSLKSSSVSNKMKPSSMKKLKVNGVKTPESTHKRPRREGRLLVNNEDASNRIIAQSSGSMAGDDNACEGFGRKQETIKPENDNSQSDHTSGSNQSNAARNVTVDWSSQACEDDTGKLIGSKHKRLVVRPAPINPPDQFVSMATGAMHPLQMNHWMLIFSFLSSDDLCRCLCVCKTWDQWCIDRSLWSHIDLQRQRIKQTHLRGIVRRQPESLTFAGAVMTHKQLEWLVSRLPQLKSLNMSNCAWATISGLCSASCPLLESLNLSWATNVRDESFAYLIQPPSDRKPAMTIISRLHRLRTLIVSGTEMTEASLGLIAEHCPNLTTLDISFCMHVKNQGIAVLCQRKEFQENIRSVNMSGCCHLTSECLDSIKRCPHLKFVSFKNCQHIALSACQKFASEYNHHSLTVKDNKTIFLDNE